MGLEYTIYDQTTGEILRAGETTGDSALHKLQAGEAAFTGAQHSGADFYVAGGVVTARPEPDLAPLAAPVLEGDVRTLTGLPDGAVVTVSRPEGDDLSATVASDGVMEITFSHPGVYEVQIVGDFPFKSSSAEIDVQPAG